jgi:hypothetical protein
MSFRRGLSPGQMILCIIIVQERGNTWAATRAVGPPGLAAAMILYLNTFRRTSVADVAVIFARAPFLTALLGWLWLGVREARIGVSIMVNGAVADGHLIGDILAFGMTLLMAIMNADHSPAARDAHAAGCLSLGLLCPLAVWPLAEPFDTTDLLTLFLFGTQFGLGLVFSGHRWPVGLRHREHADQHAGVAVGGPPRMHVLIELHRPRRGRPIYDVGMGLHRSPDVGTEPVRGERLPAA